ncbi:MAG: hypothetical protein MZV63_07850 [Marinilabiliales bacterium]|nr:hypothetical protein [Marinilabiliales bacterium]
MEFTVYTIRNRWPATALSGASTARVTSWAVSVTAARKQYHCRQKALHRRQNYQFLMTLTFAPAALSRCTFSWVSFSFAARASSRRFASSLLIDCCCCCFLTLLILLILLLVVLILLILLVLILLLVFVLLLILLLLLLLLLFLQLFLRPGQVVFCLDIIRIELKGVDVCLYALFKLLFLYQ